ncbi:MAG: sn-glycerol-3-phosphate ABC transporter ATP-binding protein UgpC [bacterium]|nr:sn-glycerol-3-phosphate ABC transporter ATP-binding protein UgpC [bacterium]MXV89950.1 sn-glycerol-3-phosphate ABC transporter ATP-binding protein UgpC [Acidimicrobiia bacterium]MYC44738.1 sn-glycerol-3-phosphate ABC transporter ATP-binding protein UgpC [Acidimicrobiia bacterium]MYI20601.1 sn-glycerol-3-phosphate ABC transporter ATP-binding protein UgpC [Acidimicrobiia bacterium]
MGAITLDNCTKVYPNGVRAVDDLSLQINDGEFMVLVGPSGCGKSTMLRMIAGLEEVTEGTITIGDRDVTDLAPPERDIAMVFQNYALYPHMSVRENLGFGLRMRKIPKAQREEHVNAVARTLGLGELLDRKPAALSGGQRQRVAMGRAMVREPAAFLMDEPLSNLDAKLRVAMRSELVRLHARLQTTSLFVTHDQTEAMTLGQRVAVLRDGVLQQCDTPQQLFSNPVNLFVGAFIGSPSMNFVEAAVAGGSVVFPGLGMPLPEHSPLAGQERSVLVGIRPTDFAHSDDAAADLPRMQVVPSVVEELGAETYVVFTIDAPRVDTEATRAAAEAERTDEVTLLADEEGAVFTARVDPRRAPRVGEPLELAVDSERVHFFDPDTGDAIRAT